MPEIKIDGATNDPAYKLEVEKRLGILNRMHQLRKTLCQVNCKPLLHRPACKAMKKDIEYLKELIA